MVCDRLTDAAQQLQYLLHGSDELPPVSSAPSDVPAPAQSGSRPRPVSTPPSTSPSLTGGTLVEIHGLTGPRAGALNGQWGELCGSSHDGARLQLRLMLEASPTVLIRPDHVRPLDRRDCMVFYIEERDADMACDMGGEVEESASDSGSDSAYSSESEIIGSMARDEVTQQRGWVVPSGPPVPWSVPAEAM